MANAIFKNITIIGTSHISEESVDTVAKYIENHKPYIVAVELDKDRMISLMTKEPEEIKNGKKGKKKKKESNDFSLLFKVGPFGYFFFLLGHYAQKKLGGVVNLEPGADMKSALECARKNNINIALIDQHILITLKKISKAFTIGLFFKILKDLILSLFGAGPKINVDINLKKVPDEKTIEKLMDIVKKTYPGLYNVLIDERNRHMARRLIVISKKHPDKHIVAVVGAGHKKGLLEYLNSMYDKIELID